MKAGYDNRETMRTRSEDVLPTSAGFCGIIGLWSSIALLGQDVKDHDGKIRETREVPHKNQLSATGLQDYRCVIHWSLKSVLKHLYQV